MAGVVVWGLDVTPTLLLLLAEAPKQALVFPPQSVDLSDYTLKHVLHGLEVRHPNFAALTAGATASIASATGSSFVFGCRARVSALRAPGRWPPAQTVRLKQPRPLHGSWQRRCAVALWAN